MGRWSACCANAVNSPMPCGSNTCGTSSWLWRAEACFAATPVRCSTTPTPAISAIRSAPRTPRSSHNDPMQSERDKMLAGEPYNPQEPELVAARQRAASLCRRINDLDASHPERRDLLKDLLGAGGDTVTVTSPFFCDYGTQIELGEQVYFNFN